MAISILKITFTATVPDATFLQIDIDNRYYSENPIPGYVPHSIFEQFALNTPNRPIPNTVPIVADPVQQAKNFWQSLKKDYQERNGVTFEYYGTDFVEIRVEKTCPYDVEFDIVNTDTQSSIQITESHQTCVEIDPAEVVTTQFSEHAQPCDRVNVAMIMSKTIKEFETYDTSYFPNSNAISFDILRGQTSTITGIDIDDVAFSIDIVAPPLFSEDDFSLIQSGNAEVKTITVATVENELTFTYRIDGGDWQTLNEFNVNTAGTYIIDVKDQYGCIKTKNITVEEWFYNEPQLIERTYCGNLHELNVGKYLNLFNKQHTMKIGFVCNPNPQTIKIFKHIQMILNTDYSIKNATIKSSQDQERFVPGNHMTYRIRESMHSVPLKNPRDWEDIRGSWAYIELEIESVNNKKVDLFSVITHLRQSSI